VTKSPYALRDYFVF